MEVHIYKHTEYFEALFLGGNLYAFSLSELMRDLTKIYGFKKSDITTPLYNVKNLN